MFNLAGRKPENLKQRNNMFNNILDALVAVFVGLMLAVGALAYFDVLTY